MKADTQKASPTDTIVPGKGPPSQQLKEIKQEKVKQLSDTTGNQPKKSALVDTTVQNKYGDLLNDDTAYNKRYPVWRPVAQVIGVNGLLLGIDKYVFKYDFSTTVGVDSWKHNLRTGWEWDNDRFGVNFAGHPYTGSLYFNAGRSNGYGYFESYAFALEGSVMWEYFGENTLPSYNDVINTTVNGVFLGEVLYRLSANVLDDRTSGVERFSREVLATIIDPMRGFNRLLQGKSWRRTNKEVYEKEPLNITINSGFRSAKAPSEGPSQNSVFSKGNTGEFINFQFDYGNAFENRTRKPFDFFKLRTEFNSGEARKILDNVMGYGILFGQNITAGKTSFLIGGFQSYDYWDNKTFELLTIGFGGGLFSKFNFNETSNLYTNVHVAAVPFGANSRLSGPDTLTEVRDYSYDGGWEGKIETTLNLGKHVTASVDYYYYSLNTYSSVVKKDYTTPVDQPGSSVTSILKPNIALHIMKWLSVGFEHYIYYNNRYINNTPAFHSTQTEEKVFLQIYLEDKQRRGHYQ